MEYSWEVSVIFHALALMKNRYFDGNLDVNAIVVAAGNQGFSITENDIEANLKSITLPEVKYFLDTFSSSYELTLDELFK